MKTDKEILIALLMYGAYFSYSEYVDVAGYSRLRSLIDRRFLKNERDAVAPSRWYVTQKGLAFIKEPA